MIALQELLFPKPETCPQLEMYFRTDAGQKHAYIDSGIGAMRVPQWCALDLDTYFNSFSIGKWRKYTRLDNLTLRLELSGEFRVQLVHWQRLKAECLRTVVAERTFRAEGRQAVELAFPAELEERGVYAASLYAVGKDCALYGGGYFTEADPRALNDIDIALDICTFRREAYIARNLKMLYRDILENPDCELRDHLEVFVSDNGRTLDARMLGGDRVHIFPNRNVGGAGGFTRGMIEILDHPRAFSHVLVMDDDVLINVDTILRTYRLLRLLKPEYAGKTIAGALMRLDKRCVQYENGAAWLGTYIPVPLKEKLDMREIENVLFNEQEETTSYNGWWYSCIPMAKIDNDNLPLPLFLHRDDIEFGMRTGSDILALNGICVWHETFDNKYASNLEYYEARNDLILNALHMREMPARAIGLTLLRRCVGNIIRYRYANCALIFRGVEDFCKGPDALMQLDPEALNRDLLAVSDKLVPVEQLDLPFSELAHDEAIEKRKDFIEVARIFFLNGIFLPAKGTNVVNIATSWPRNYYRKRAVLNYDELTGRGFVSRRSFRQSMRAMGRSLRCILRLMRRYQTVAAAWREAMPIMTSRSFWNEYLGLR